MGLQVAAAGKIINEFTGLAFAGGEFETDNPAIRFVSAEAWTRDAQGAHITFATAPIGTSSPVEGMRLTSEGILLVGTDTASGSAKLQVSGAINVSGMQVAGTATAYSATVYNPTAVTGSSSLVVRAGAGQSTNALTTWQDNAASTLLVVDSAGQLIGTPGGNRFFYVSKNSIQSYLQHAGGVATLGTESASALVFTTTDTERGRFLSGGGFQVTGDTLIVTTAKTPSSAADTGTTGQIAWDASYVYVCTATNTWKRAAIATW